MQNASAPFSPSAEQCKACYASSGCCPQTQMTRLQACVANGTANCKTLSAAQQSQLYGWGECASSSLALVRCEAPASGNCELVFWRLWVTIFVPIGATALACIVLGLTLCLRRRRAAEKKKHSKHKHEKHAQHGKDAKHGKDAPLEL
jgi:hypothetical protein